MPKKKTVWKTHETDQISIALPDTFIAGHPFHDRASLKEEVNDLPENVRKIFKTLFSNRNFVFLAADRGFNPEMSSLTCLVVLPERVPLFKAKSGIEDYFKMVKKNLGQGFETVEEEYFEKDGIQAGRVLAFQNERKTRKNPEPQTSRKHLMYAFRLKKNYWAFDFIADASVFDKFLPLFDQSIKSLTFKEKAK